MKNKKIPDFSHNHKQSTSGYCSGYNSKQKLGSLQISRSTLPNIGKSESKNPRNILSISLIQFWCLVFTLSYLKFLPARIFLPYSVEKLLLRAEDKTLGKKRMWGTFSKSFENIYGLQNK